MRPGAFKIKGINSIDHKIFIQERPEILTPKRKVDHKNVYGMSGTLPFDEEAYDNTIMNLLCYVEGDTTKTSEDNRTLVYDIFDSGGYFEFIPYFDEKKIHRVMVEETPMFNGTYIHEEGQPFTVGLTVKPYKYYTESEKIIRTTPGTITNPYSQETQPLIKVVGSGNVTLTFNGVNFVIQNLTTDIWLDCEAMYAYRELSGGIIDNQNSKIFTTLYPYLRKGNTVISWTGNVSRIEIEPRWRTLA